MAMNRTANLSSIDARLRSMALSSAGNLNTIGDYICKTSTTDRAYEIFNSWVGVGTATIVPEGNIYGEKTPVQNNSKTLTVEKYGFVINATREQIEDGQFAPIAGEIGKAGRNAMVETKEQAAVNLLNNGFDTNYPTPDGSVALFSASHVLVQGGTQSNTATAAALDLDTFWAGINAMRTTKDDSSLYASIYNPDVIVVPQALQRKALEITRSNETPFTTENQINVVKNFYSIEVKSSPLLTSTTAWFMLAKPSEVINYGLRRVIREPLAVKRMFQLGDPEIGGSIEDRDIYSWKFRERYTHGLTHWIGTYGNAGAA